MENAGKEDMPDDAERKGIGTPATRSGIIEKLVSSGFVERRKSKKITNLLPTSTGTALITVLPEQLQSPQLTAEWEHRLKEIERGEIAPDSFMDGIAAMLNELVQTYKPIPGAEVLFPSGREAVGKCPRCGAEVTESQKGFFCENRACSFVLWKNSRFFTAKKKVLTKSLAAALLKNGRAPLKGCYSEKTGKTYDASVLLEDDGQRTGYKLVFDNSLCAAVAYPDPVRLAVRGATVLLWLRVQAGKRTALPAGFRRDDYLLCKKRHYPPCAGVSNQPDGTSAAGGAGTWQAARRERCHEKLHP